MALDGEEDGEEEEEKVEEAVDEINPAAIRQSKSHYNPACFKSRVLTERSRSKWRRCLDRAACL